MYSHPFGLVHKPKKENRMNPNQNNPQEELLDRINTGLKSRLNAQIGDIYSISFPGQNDDDRWHVQGWVLVATLSKDPNTFLAMPVADFSEMFYGSPDVHLPECETACELNVHCGVSLFIPRAIIEQGFKMCFLDSHGYGGGRNLDKLQKKMKEIFRFQVTPETEAQQERDCDPYYQEHMCHVRRVHAAIMDQICNG
ncbi:MAG: hypothetical protein Q8O32_00660 [bacterium]|nr:hypothetical protein [bacterium]